MATATGDTRAASIHPGTTIGAVSLTVSDLARSQRFYEQVVGLRGTEREDGAVLLGSEGGEPLVELHGDASAPALDRRATGLFHVAVLLPSRRELALALIRLAQARWPLDGASDHLVSEALYLSDPDGNGIEIYRDRPRSEWPQKDGSLQMATIPLDLDDVLSAAERSDGQSPAIPALVPDGTAIGHAHLQVSDLADAEAFYSGVLGFDVTVRGYPGALFVSAGGYHHHIGLNTWHSAGAAAPVPGSIGLRSYEIKLPDASELEAVRSRVSAAGLPLEQDVDGSTFVRDPAGNGVRLTARPR
jgi:catechol 2,3-dioxygenase